MLRSPIAATDINGKKLWEQHYQPYGERLDKAVGADNPQWYTGKVEDKDDGLMYYGARYYDPVIGRFMAVDPVGFNAKKPMSFNRYAYAADNPYFYTDPTGMLEETYGYTPQTFNPGPMGSYVSQPYNHSFMEQAQDFVGYIATPLMAESGMGGVLDMGLGAIGRAARWFGGLSHVEQVVGAKKPTVSSLNPFKSKSATEIDEMFANKGFAKKGPDPQGGYGGYVNPKTGRSYHIDPKEYGKFDEPNHVDVNRPRGYSGKLVKKKFNYKLTDGE